LSVIAAAQRFCPQQSVTIALLFAVATDLANAIVGFAEAMTIKARKIRDVLQEVPGTLSVLEERKRTDAGSSSDFRGGDKVLPVPTVVSLLL
jgi:hypothetical protein